MNCLQKASSFTFCLCCIKPRVEYLPLCENTKLNSIYKGDAEDLVIKLVDTLHNKGVQRQSQFIEVLQDEIVLETYPTLKDVEWGDSGTASSSSSKRPAEEIEKR